MEVLDLYKTGDKELWLSQMEKCDWGAGHYLAYLLKENKLHKLVGNARVLMLVEGENLVSFCTLAQMDDVQPTDLTPWIGFLYTFPEYRGKRLAGNLLSHAEKLAREDGAIDVYISTNHIGLYEKYGYEFFIEAKDVEDENTRIYQKKI